MKYRDRKPALRAAALAAAALMGLGLCSIPAAAEEEPQIQVITQTASSSALVDPAQCNNYLTISEAGTYEEEGTYRQVVIEKGGVELKNKVIYNLFIRPEVNTQIVRLENVTVTGNIYVYTGARVKMTDCQVAGITGRYDGSVNLYAIGDTTIENVLLNTDAFLWCEKLAEDAGAYQNVTVRSATSKYLNVTLNNAKVENISTYLPTNLSVTKGSRVENVTCYDQTAILGTGEVGNLFAKSSGVTYEEEPEYIKTDESVSSTPRLSDEKLDDDSVSYNVVHEDWYK